MYKFKHVTNLINLNFISERILHAVGIFFCRENVFGKIDTDVTSAQNVSVSSRSFTITQRERKTTVFYMIIYYKRLTKTESRLKPFGFCCSVERFDPLARYDQRSSPYRSSLPAITSVHECPVSKMRVQFHHASRPGRNKGRPIRIKPAEEGDQQRSNKIARLMYLNKIDNRSRNTIRWCLEEDEIALAKNLLWREKQKLHKEEGDKATITARKKCEFSEVKVIKR